MSEPTPPTPQDRLLAAFRALVRAEFPQFSYGLLYEYTIVSTDGTTLECKPTDTTVPVPALTKVALLPSVSGETVTLTSDVEGLHCTIGFLNADPTKPRCISIDPRPGAAPAARSGDTVTITPTQFTAATPVAGATPVTISSNMTATITSGSTKVSLP